MNDDDEDYERYNKFEDGHWIWDEEEKILDFVSHKEVVDEEEEVIAGDELFRDDIDVLEQLAFKQKFFRKLRDENDPDIITLQDIKDVVLFTAQKHRLTKKLIKSLHTMAYDKFLRNLIVYTQYYMQLRSVMEKRAADSVKMIRLPQSDVIEGILEKNLADIRALVARDFLYAKLDGCKEGKIGRIFMLGEEMKFTELIIKISFQAVWIALLRPDLARIEPEVNRIFRTPQFNKVIEWKIKPEKFSQYEDRVFFRKVPVKIKLVHNKFNELTPMSKDLLKYTQDFRLVGLGVLGFEPGDCSMRLEYIDDIMFAPEEALVKENIKVGILGEPRNKFDAMLIEIPIATKQDGSKSTMHPSSISSSSKKSRSIRVGSFHIPDICDDLQLPDYFPELPSSYKVRPVNQAQKKRWLDHVTPKKKTK